MYQGEGVSGSYQGKVEPVQYTQIANTVLRYFPTICRLPGSKKVGVCCKVEQSSVNVTTTTTPQPASFRCGQVVYNTINSQDADRIEIPGKECKNALIRIEIDESV